MALVGESGSGKSTLARVVTGLAEPTAGRILWQLHSDAPSSLVPVSASSPAALRRARQRCVQMVFQDPWASLDPRWTAGQSIAEPLAGHPPSERSTRVRELLDTVGLSPDLATRYPHQLSGGQRQRVAIARALAPSPRLLVLDEATAALDVSIQAQIVNLLLDLQRRRSLALLVIAHDLGLVTALAHHVGVLWKGRLVEFGTPERVFQQPAHPYTQSLLTAHPDHPEREPDRRRPADQRDGPPPATNVPAP